MESRFSPIVDGIKKKQYCDKSFKNALGKSLTVNNGDPDNINKINNAKKLQEYPASRIIDFTNNLSSDIQNAIEVTIEDPEVQNIVKLAKNMETFTKQERADGVKSVTHLLSHSDKIESYRTTNNVDFKSLYKYINSAVSGFPDVIPLNESSLDVLFGAYKALMEQVDKDATPELLNDLKNAMIYGEDIPMESKFEELSKCLNVPSLNPLGLPFSYMFNGVIPDLSNNEQTDIEMESIEEGITSNKIPCQPECNNQITSSSIKKEKTPHTVKDTSDFKENLSFESDESDDEKTEQNTNPNKKVKICRRSKRSAKQNIY